MPMSFPNMDSLKSRALQRGFRKPLKDEPEDDYRRSFANYMLDIDSVESSEIRSSVGWDQQSPNELLSNIFRPLVSGVDDKKQIAGVVEGEVYYCDLEKGDVFEFEGIRYFKSSLSPYDDTVALSFLTAGNHGERILRRFKSTHTVSKIACG